MYSITAQSGHTAAYVTSYVVDTESDVSTLPTDVGIGSDCIVIETSNVYILGNDKEWKLL